MFSLQVRRARLIKYKPRGIYWPPAQGGSEVRRHLWEQLKLAFSVNDSSRSRLASRSVCYRLPRHLLLQIVICIIKYHRLKAPPICELGMYSYYKLVLTMLTISLASYCSVDRMESVLDDCLAQFSSKCVLKEEQCQAVLGLLERKDVVAPVLPRVLGKANLRHLFADLPQRSSNKEKRTWY